MPKPQDVKRYENFLKSCVRCRNISKTFDGRAVPASLDLTLKISIDDEDVHAIGIKKKGDFIDIEYFGTIYRLHPGQVGDCEFFEKPDKEVLENGKWEQYMIFRTKEPDKQEETSKPAEVETSKLDEIMRDLKGR
ncbi:MAG: hypothetical protein NTY99_03940 [DPANN group archaeon]|nr:hypothetical protein [DPANN group archaeon]